MPDPDHQSQEDQFLEDELPSAQGNQDMNPNWSSPDMRMDLNEETLVDNDQYDESGPSNRRSEIVLPDDCPMDWRRQEFGSSSTEPPSTAPYFKIKYD